MPSFHGGPLDGQLGYAPGVDPPAEQLAAQAMPEQQQQDQPTPGDTPDQGGGDAGSSFDRIMSEVMDLAMSDGQVSESEKLIMQQIGTLLQKLKTDRQKQQAQAIQGSPTSPAVGQAYAGG